MHSLLLIGWLRAILCFVPLKRKEYVLAAGHYKVRSLFLRLFRLRRRLLLLLLFLLILVLDHVLIYIIDTVRDTRLFCSRQKILNDAVAGTVTIYD